MLFEFRGTVKTAKELFEMFKGMDANKNNRISFVELCCAYFNKSYDELFTFVDEEARHRAMEEAARLGEEAKKAEEEIERAKTQKELQAQLRAAALERESKLVSSFLFAPLFGLTFL
jgi:predicted Rossmann-fold nucleotide-binding protein